MWTEGGGRKPDLLWTS